MAKISVTTTTTEEVLLTTKQRHKLLQELKIYQELKQQRDAIELAMEKHKTAIGAIRDETGEMSLSVDGFKTTLVAGSRKKFDPKKYVTLGGDLDLYNRSVKTTPVKPFEKITCPGEKEETYE